MSQQHFLGNISNDSWVGHIGTQMMLSFGPESIRKLTLHHQRLCGIEGVLHQSIDVDTLPDFCIRQVRIAGDMMATDEVEELGERAAENDDPVVVRPNLCRDLLLLVDEYDELIVSQLAIHRHGGITFDVRLDEEFNGRSFRIDGEMRLARLTEMEAKEPAR